MTTDSGEFAIPESRSQDMAAMFLFILVTRSGGSITIPSKVWARMATAFAGRMRVNLKADRLGSVTAWIPKEAGKKKHEAKNQSGR